MVASDAIDVFEDTVLVLHSTASGNDTGAPAGHMGTHAAGGAADAGPAAQPDAGGRVSPLLSVGQRSPSIPGACQKLKTPLVQRALQHFSFRNGVLSFGYVMDASPVRTISNGERPEPAEATDGDGWAQSSLLSDTAFCFAAQLRWARGPRHRTNDHGRRCSAGRRISQRHRS